MKNKAILRPLTAAIAFFGVLLAGVDAAVIFTAEGNDLNVTFTSPIRFTVDAAEFSAEYGISIEDAYTESQLDNYAKSTGDATMTLNASPSSMVGGNAGTIGFTVGVSDPTDLALTWDFGGDQPIGVGDIVTISTGMRMIPGFISNGGIAPDSGSSTLSVELFGSGAVAIAPPVQVAVVPEPSTGLLCALVCAGFLFRCGRAEVLNYRIESND